MSKPFYTIARKFDDEGTRDIHVETLGQRTHVGYIERECTEEFRSVTSYARKEIVTGYNVVWFDGVGAVDLAGEDDANFDTIAQATAHVAKVLAKWGVGKYRAPAKTTCPTCGYTGRRHLPCCTGNITEVTK